MDSTKWDRGLWALLVVNYLTRVMVMYCLICIYPFHLHYIIRLVAIPCYIPRASLHGNVPGAMHVFKLKIECNWVDRDKVMHLVYFFVLPIGDGWEYHMLQVL